MATDRRRTLLQTAACLVCLASLALAEPQGPPSWWPGSGSNGNGNGNSGSGTSGNNGNTGTGAANGNGNGNGNFGGFGSGNGNGNNGNNGNFPNGLSQFLGFDINQAMYIRTVHGVLASVAFVILFPIGSILMRVIPGRFALWTHALTQVLSLFVYIVAAGLGFYLINVVRLPFQDGTLLNNPDINYHPIIGIIVLVFVLLQPILGYIHHAKFKVLKRRQIWSYLHLWNGRIMITLGIINGGLGLLVSRAPDQFKTAYTVVAVVMWVAWLLAALLGECRRAIGARRERRQRRKELRRDAAAAKTVAGSESSVS